MILIYDIHTILYIIWLWLMTYAYAAYAFDVTKL